MSTCEIMSMVPVDDGGARGFDFTLQVANNYDGMVINSRFYNFFFD